jgi:hypothetical protein
MAFSPKDIGDTPFRDIPIEAKREAWREMQEGEATFGRACQSIQGAANAHDMEKTLFWQFVLLVWAKRLGRKPEDFDHYDNGDGCYQHCMNA